MPAAYESVIEQLIMNTAGLKNENCVSEAVAILKAYLDRWNDRVPRISRMQEISLAAGLEYLGCRAAGAEVSEEEICKKYRISPLRLHNAVNKLTAPRRKRDAACHGSSGKVLVAQLTLGMRTSPRRTACSFGGSDMCGVPGTPAAAAEVAFPAPTEALHEAQNCALD